MNTLILLASFCIGAWGTTYFTHLYLRKGKYILPGHLAMINTVIFFLALAITFVFWCLSLILPFLSELDKITIGVLSFILGLVFGFLLGFGNFYEYYEDQGDGARVSWGDQLTDKDTRNKRRLPPTRRPL